MTHSIERITDLPPDFGELVAASSREQFTALERLRREWDSGANQFDRPGEVLLEARIGSRLVGICGLNRDPYLQSSEVGRVRHLYVHPSFRRRGIGRALISRIIACGRGGFVCIRLRTLSEAADSFYVAMGFRRVSGTANATHELTVS